MSGQDMTMGTVPQAPDSTLLDLGKDNEPAITGTGSKTGLFTILLFAFAVAALMLVLVFSISIFRSANNVRMDTDEARSSLSLIANSIRLMDSTDSVGYAASPEGNALVLAEDTPSGVFETRYYLYNGNVVQEYSRAGLSYDPSKALKVAGSSTFGFEYEDGLLTVTTDQGSVDILLRSARY